MFQLRLTGNIIFRWYSMVIHTNCGWRAYRFYDVVVGRNNDWVRMDLFLGWFRCFLPSALLRGSFLLPRHNRLISCTAGGRRYHYVTTLCCVSLGGFMVACSDWLRASVAHHCHHTIIVAKTHQRHSFWLIRLQMLLRSTNQGQDGARGLNSAPGIGCISLSFLTRCLISTPPRDWAPARAETEEQNRAERNRRRHNKSNKRFRAAKAT